MKALSKVLTPVLLCLAMLLSLASCDKGEPVETGTPGGTEITVKDYASEVKLDMSSGTLKQEATVKAFIDGDTTHFSVPSSVAEDGVLKARYLAINTPESTGTIEEYGKKASSFTREKLSSAVSIIIESDGASWELDSTGGRFLVWIWYKTEASAEYRNLNIEILQNGLAIASSSANNRYGQVCVAALSQAKAQKLSLYSGEKDPDFYYGDAAELTLKELRLNTAKYDGVKVAFEGIITSNNENSVTVESYDAETDMYYGISVYYGYSLPGAGLEVLSVGNLSRIVGTVQYYEVGGTYQVSGLSYRMMKPDDPGNIKKLGEGYSASFRPTDAETFIKKGISVETQDGSVTFDYAALAMNTSVSMQSLFVKSVYTTQSGSSSAGAMTLTCESQGIEISVRTAVLYDENRKLITKEAYLGKYIDIKGFVDYFDGSYQVKVFSAENIDIIK